MRGSKRDTTRDVAVFALVRGYEKNWKYSVLVLRNLFLRFFLWRSRLSARSDMILFHEGNITRRAQSVLTALSMGPVRFINVSSIFRRGPHHVWTRHNESEGYSLMCKFNYYDLWNYLKHYEIAMRVDEDCLILTAPRLNDDEIFTTGLVSAESHEPTNRSLPPFLRTMELDQYYDHHFPYTNVYQTRTSFWFRKDVQSYLRSLWLNPHSVNERWGDLPVIGVALRAFGDWDYQKSVLPDYRYLHLSHLAFVAGGRTKGLGSELISLVRRAYRGK